jgi:hypothetical protein
MQQTLDFSPEATNLRGVASVAQLAEQLTLNLNCSFFLNFTARINSYQVPVVIGVCENLG